MAYIVHDYVCDDCGTEWEDLVSKDTKSSTCPNCGLETTTPVISATGIAAFSLLSKDARAESLKKRSRDHSKREMKRNSDEIQSKWNSGKSVKIG